MAISWSDVTAIAPELATGVTPDGQDAILAFANEAFAEVGFFGDAQLRLARINLAAHVATLEKRRGSGIAGPLIAESMGGVSRTYANVLQNRMFSGTTYGDVLNLLLQTSGARLPQVISGCGGFSGGGWGFR